MNRNQKIVLRVFAVLAFLMFLLALGSYKAHAAASTFLWLFVWLTSSFGSLWWSFKSD